MTQQRKRLGLSLPENLYGRIKDKAEYHGKTINSFCLDVFWDYFEEVHERQNVKSIKTTPGGLAEEGRRGNGKT